LGCKSTTELYGLTISYFSSSLTASINSLGFIIRSESAKTIISDFASLVATLNAQDLLYGLSDFKKMCLAFKGRCNIFECVSCYISITSTFANPLIQSNTFLRL
jgi:hypothetical protein